MAGPDAACSRRVDGDVLDPYLSLDTPRLVLDLRSDAAFHREHLVEAYHVTPLAELKSRYSYLPPRNVPFLVLGDASQHDEVVEAFSSTPAARIVLLSEGEAQHEVLPQRGSVRSCGCTSFFDSARQLGLVRSSENDQQRITTATQDVPALLFQPSNAVRRTVLRLEAEPRLDHRPLRVLDLGCGAARDLAWILHGSRTRSAPSVPGANRSRAAWTGIGIDNWKAALRRAEQLMDDLYLTALSSHPQQTQTSAPLCEKLLWAKCTDSGQLEPLVGTGKGRSICTAADDVDAWSEYVNVGLGPLLPAHDEAESVGTQAQFDLILCVRFHPRALLPRLNRLVRPGGIVLLSHFVTLSDAERDALGQAHPQAILDYDSPPHEGRIQPGEVEALVDDWSQSSDWTVAETHLEPIEDGRIIKSVALRKTTTPTAPPDSAS